MTDETPDATEATELTVEHEPEPEVADAPTAEAAEYVPHLAEPEPEASESAEPVPDGHVRLVYTGFADVVKFKEHTFRGGQPVIVPSDVAEELLTLPNESFEPVS